MLSRGAAIRRLARSGFSTQVAKWDILTAVCLERFPVVTPNLNSIQLKYQKYLDEYDLANSYKSDHEIRGEQDIIILEKIKNDTIEDVDTINKVTAHDFEDACTDELSKFTFAPIVTEADKKNDVKSLERKLQSHLLLLVEQQIGNEKKFLLPQGKHQPGETLRQTAERVFKETCGDDLNVQFYGNAPCGYMSYKYKGQESESIGVKLFFYYARHLNGQVNQKAQYKWSTRNELENILSESYHSTINKFLVEERNE